MNGASCRQLGEGNLARCANQKKQQRRVAVPQLGLTAWLAEGTVRRLQGQGCSTLCLRGRRGRRHEGVLSGLAPAPLADGTWSAPIHLVQQALGHASVATTG